MDYYSEIKNELIYNEVYKKVKDYSKNRSDLTTYYNVGKLLRQAGKHYGDSVVKEYSIKLTKEIGKKYSTRVLYKMIKYYEFLSKEKVPTVSAKLPWSHYDEVLKLNDINEINYYINVSITQNLSVRELREKIKKDEYNRIDEKTKEKLINKEKLNVSDLVKNPIIVKNSNNYKVLTEKILKQLILEDLDNFLKELGSGFCYIENEYKIKLGDRFNYIDLLLFNIKYNCYVVVELKITELQKEYIGQIQTYMNYIGKNIKGINHDKTIGIIIVKKNKFIMEYCSDERIFETTYLIQ